MQYEWIMDVLTDLKVFAKSNGLSALAEQLDDTSLVAVAEIAQRTADKSGSIAFDGTEAGSGLREATTGRNAQRA